MPLPTFLTPNQLADLSKRVMNARNEVNAIAEYLREHSELNLVGDVQKASGKLWSVMMRCNVAAAKRHATNTDKDNARVE